MSQPPTEQEIGVLLNELNSESAKHREATIKKLGGPLLNDERIVNVLESLAARDVKQYVRDAARAALVSAGRTPPESMVPPAPPIGHVYTTNSEKILDFAVGFVGWFGVNVIAWFLLLGGKSINSGNNILPNLFLLPLTLAALLIFAFLRRWMAFGILVAVAANLVIALVLGMQTNALCAIPFLVK